MESAAAMSLLLAGGTIALHATDADAHWLLDLTGDIIAWRRADEPAVAGPEVTGDNALVTFWLERVGFG